MVAPASRRAVEKASRLSHLHAVAVTLFLCAIYGIPIWVQVANYIRFKGDPSYMENDSSYHAFLIDGRFAQEARSLNSIYSIPAGNFAGKLRLHLAAWPGALGRSGNQF